MNVSEECGFSLGKKKNDCERRDLFEVEKHQNIKKFLNGGLCVQVPEKILWTKTSFADIRKFKIKTIKFIFIFNI